MDSNIILTRSIIILTIISIVVIFKLKNKNEERRIFSVLQSFAKENNSTISKYDHWYKTLIGIDNREINKLFFIRTIGDKKLREAIDLSEVMNCQLVKTGRTVHIEKKKVKVIDKIELIFSFIDHKKPELALEFYNNDYDQLTLLGELQLAEKWDGIVNAIISANKKRNYKGFDVKISAQTALIEPINHVRTVKHSIKRKPKYADHETHAF